MKQQLLSHGPLRLLTFLLAITLVLTSTGVNSFGQTIVTGELSGTVTDQTGAAIPGVTVTAKNDSSGEIRSANTNQQGEYHLPLLRPGAYTITTTATGSPM